MARQKRTEQHPGLAAILSFLYNGLGQLYNGELIKGLAIIAVSSLGMIFTLAGAILLGRYFLSKVPLHIELLWGLSLLGAGILLIACIGTYSIFDAYHSAKKGLRQ